MKIIVTGSTGMVGNALVPRLLADGHAVTRFVRAGGGRQASDGTRVVTWDVEGGLIDDAEIAAHDAVIHLAGEPVAEGRWTDEKKRRIRDSRVHGTRLVAESIKRARASSAFPHTLVCASATGFYGNRGDEILDERSASGADFLAGVCREWEASADAARDAGVRVVHARLGVVLGSQGGALPKMLTPFRLGAGGTVGTGGQYMSWVAIDDVVEAFRFALTHDSLAGAVNIVVPEPVTNREFTETLGRVLRRPTLFAVPKFAARLAFGEVADALLLASTRVVPRRLQEESFAFGFPRLEAALRHVIDGSEGK